MGRKKLVINALHSFIKQNSRRQAHLQLIIILPQMPIPFVVHPKRAKKFQRIVIKYNVSSPVPDRATVLTFTAIRHEVKIEDNSKRQHEAYQKGGAVESLADIG